MLLSITNTYESATDLGYLLHKNPARCQTFELSYGKAHVFYPQASAQICTAALLLDVDPIGLVRNRRGPAGEGYALEQYVNDRPYVASSLLSVAIAQVFNTALSGRCKDRPDLVNVQLPLLTCLAVVPCRGGEDVLRRLFTPLGYEVRAQRHPLDENFPDWGESVYYSVKLQGTKTVHDLLTHLYVLIPVLDDDKHYWVGDDEVEKLLKHGAGWLADHPEREMITHRYLKHRRNLAEEALSRLIQEEEPDADQNLETHAVEEAAVETPLSLNEQRIGTVVAALRDAGAKSVLDLGCGEGRLLRELLKNKHFERIVGMDVSHRALELASDKLRLDRLPPAVKQRIELIQGSLLYRDKRLSGFDAAAVVEVIEHLDPPRFAAFERVLFEYAKPKAIVLTTPNVEYNVKFKTLPAGNFRHRDHRFEWSRSQFQAWARGVGERFRYGVKFVPIGPDDPETGSPTQMALFNLIAEKSTSNP